MAIFAVVVAAIAGNLGPLDRTAQLVLGLFLAIVPSALWLWYFYRQDRLEPEPKTHIGLVFVAALVLTDFLALRVINDWFQVGVWSSANTWTSLGASILINGFILQACMYIAVRLVYTGSEFDERMDGIVYGTVAGLGVADPVEPALHHRQSGRGAGAGCDHRGDHRAGAGVVRRPDGLVHGRRQSSPSKPFWFVPLGFTIAAVLNGLFSWLINEVSAAGLGVEPIRSLILGLLVALATFGVLVWLMNRSTEVTLRRRRIKRTHALTRRQRLMR